MHYSLSLQNMVVLPPNFPDSGTSILYVHLAPYASTTKAHILSRHVRAHTYIKHKWCGFWYPFSFGSTGVSIKWNPNIFISKIYKIYLYHNKTLLNAFAAAMCTFVHSSMHMSGVSVSMVYIRCMSCRMCMHV